MKMARVMWADGGVAFVGGKAILGKLGVVGGH